MWLEVTERGVSWRKNERRKRKRKREKKEAQRVVRGRRGVNV